MALVELNLNPAPRQLRTFGLIGLAVFGGLAAWAAFQGRLFGMDLGPEAARLAGFTLAGLAGLCGVLAAAWPKGLKPLFIGLSVITLPIGLVVSHVVMLALFFLVLTPLGLAMRAGGWDAMERRLSRGEKTYWKRRSPAPRVDRYFRQF